MRQLTSYPAITCNNFSRLIHRQAIFRLLCLQSSCTSCLWPNRTGLHRSSLSCSILLPAGPSFLHPEIVPHRSKFCTEASHPPLPTTKDTSLLFVSYLAKQSLSHASIKVYLSAVHNLHVSTGLHEEFSKHLTPRPELVLKGIKKKAKSAPPPSLLPVTVEIMRSIKTALTPIPTDYDNTLLWATCCLAFFGFLRCAEFTVPTQEGYDPDMHLSLADIALDGNNSVSGHFYVDNINDTFWPKVTTHFYWLWRTPLTDQTSQTNHWNHQK